MRPLNLLHDYYTNVHPNSAVLELCGAAERDAPYSSNVDEDLTVIVNGWGRPEFLPLIWEAVQYQTRRPQETWIIQNDPDGRAAVPRTFLDRVHDGYNTRVIESGLNHGCWFRFIVAALSCRTKYVAIYDDDTLSARGALEAALSDMARKPALYGGRGIILNFSKDGPSYWEHEIHGWPAGTETPRQVDFVGHLWLLETYWLSDILRHLPDSLLSTTEPESECGEDMYLSFIAQKRDIPTFVYGHGGGTCNPSWSSIQAYEMGFHQNAMFNSGRLAKGDEYLQRFVADGWRLLRY
jgi:hypothetical protein